MGTRNRMRLLKKKERCNTDESKLQLKNVVDEIIKKTWKRNYFQDQEKTQR